ncbi:hypothetical protein IJX73_01955 [bacterium]|nr:hypothetical protein [bacterium]MBQ9149673.1 hypothetical protein [bacterium]
MFQNTHADELALINQNTIQTRIDNIGTNLLNSNRITKRIVFAYDNENKKSLLELKDELTKRQIIVYDDLYKTVQTDDELAAALAREISLVMKSYSGMWGGRLDSIQVAVSSKKFEKVADKRAVDYMVRAGYNPLALIIHINKTCPQKRSDFISRHNLTSKRLALIYEYLTFKYPSYLENNEFINDKYYQNFLLTSIENRAKLKEKVRTRCTKAIKYE